MENDYFWFRWSDSSGRILFVTSCNGAVRNIPDICHLALLTSIRKPHTPKHSAWHSDLQSPPLVGPCSSGTSLWSNGMILVYFSSNSRFDSWWRFYTGLRNPNFYSERHSQGPEDIWKLKKVEIINKSFLTVLSSRPARGKLFFFSKS